MNYKEGRGRLLNSNWLEYREILLAFNGFLNKN